ncbi:hypothetical protein TVVG_00045 [Tetraselmis viridis virus SI1]|uniref:hypothetical protein n=1 Tax=Tetraselmis viridis virus S20 TaxID=754070 RepID=UPI0002C1176F|nr:hypothetical protein TVGG_00011 [Tetraselmis viridis virus S20]AGH31339.1 hypothetical protein TVGG_00011 [Tetraselmis viridis virus S20]AGH31427.1 hypothetical protein TVVG_00045 [Tetraselmis viridis virus SI1]
MSTPVILTFDLATTSGWCCGDGASSPDLGHVTMPSTPTKKGYQELGAFMDFWDAWVTKHLDRLQPTVVGFEAPLVPQPKYNPVTRKVTQSTSMQTMRKLYALPSILEMHCHRRGIECSEVNLKSVKARLAGKGNADKADMVAMARRCGMRPKTHDEADAFGIWLYALRYYAPQHQQAWDKKLYSGLV